MARCSRWWPTKHNWALEPIKTRCTSVSKIQKNRALYFNRNKKNSPNQKSHNQLVVGCYEQKSLGLRTKKTKWSQKQTPTTLKTLKTVSCTVERGSVALMAVTIGPRQCCSCMAMLCCLQPVTRIKAPKGKNDSNELWLSLDFCTHHYTNVSKVSTKNWVIKRLKLQLQIEK